MIPPAWSQNHSHGSHTDAYIMQEYISTRLLGPSSILTFFVALSHRQI